MTVEGQHNRLRRLVEEHYEFVWRTMKRLGVEEAELDDWVQEVFIVAARKEQEIVEGKERGFLFRTASNHAAHARRSRARRREVALPEDLALVDHRTPDRALDHGDKLGKFYSVIMRMSAELREVFLLFEVEQFTQAEIAEALQIPAGTVASRIRRARESFLELLNVPATSAVAREVRP